MFRKSITSQTKILAAIFVSTAIYVVVNFYRFYKNNSPYEFDPWLINYQGGFVRRGMPGELFFQIYDIFLLNPAFLIFLFVSILYGIFYFSFFRQLDLIKFRNIHYLILLSPISIVFPILNSKVTGHKEILLFFFMSLCCLIFEKISKEKAFIVILLSIIFLGLSYEVLIFYLPYLVIIYFISFSEIKIKEFVYISIFFITVFIALLIVNLLFKGDKNTVELICQSIANFVRENCISSGNIAHIGNTIKDFTEQKTNAPGALGLYNSYLYIYGFGLFYGILPLIIFLHKAYIKLNNKLFKINFMGMMFLIFLITFPVYVLGADWGRYMYISYICTLIILAHLIFKKKIIVENNVLVSKINLLPKKTITTLIVVYSLSFTVPICCQDSFKLGLLKFFL